MAACYVCGREYGDADDLMVHTATHVGVAENIQTQAAEIVSIRAQIARGEIEDPKKARAVLDAQKAADAAQDKADEAQLKVGVATDKEAASLRTKAALAVEKADKADARAHGTKTDAEQAAIAAVKEKAADEAELKAAKARQVADAVGQPQEVHGPFGGRHGQPTNVDEGETPEQAIAREQAIEQSVARSESQLLNTGKTANQIEVEKQRLIQAEALAQAKARASRG